MQLQAYLAQLDLPADSRLPPERELCESLGVSRGDLRKALAVLEKDGRIWRHVGKGTFVGSGPIGETVAISDIAARSNPSDVMRARLILEPEIAREAALHATLDDIAAMRQSLVQTRAADDLASIREPRQSAAPADRAGEPQHIAARPVRRAERHPPHRRVGQAARRRARPPNDHHSFTDHQRIVEAIADRDLAGAAAAMRAHLQQVERRLIPMREAAE